MTLKCIIETRGDNMNYYLIGIGAQISEIRELLGWNQQQLAEKIGVSRSTLVRIEKNPNNIKKYIAHSLYLVVYKEIEDRKEKLEEINFETEDKDNLLEEINNKIGITSKTIVSSAIFAGIGPALGSLAIALFSKNKADKSDINNEKVKEITAKSLTQIEKELNNYFGIKDLNNTKEFLNKIEKEEEL